MRTESNILNSNPIKILNLYAGIGGNRKLWPETLNGRDIKVTAVELNLQIAAIYQEFYPNDTVIIANAHDYLLNHYQEFDFIWASPPCQSHSRIRYCFGFRGKKHRFAPLFPDMMLWQEIIFLKHYAKCDWVVENVIPYYKPLIAPTFQFQRHFFWSNKTVSKISVEADKIQSGNLSFHQSRLGFDLSAYKIPNKTQILRNCVAPVIGQHIFNEIFPPLTH